jgi:hypothetical protein
LAQAKWTSMEFVKMGRPSQSCEMASGHFD